jgi:hypothetical protein
LGLLGFLVAAVFAPGLYGGSITPRWDVLALVPACLLWFSVPRANVGIPAWVAILFGGFAVLSFLWTSNPLDGLHDLCKFVFLAQVFVLGARAQSLRQFYVGLGLGIGVSSVVATLQWLYTPEIIWPASNAEGIGGLFYNKDTMAAIAALALIALVSENIWWLTALVLPAIYFPMSRVALCALAAASVWYLFSRSRLITLVLVAIIVALASISVVLEYRTGFALRRLVIWQDTIDGFTWLGHGIGSFHTSFPVYERFNTDVEHAHSDILEAIFEFGIVGALFWLCVGFFTVRSVQGTAKLVFLAFVVESTFSFVGHEPATAAVGAICAGHLSRDWGPVRIPFDLGRTLLRTRLFESAKDAAGRVFRSGSGQRLVPTGAKISAGSADGTPKA